MKHCLPHFPLPLTLTLTSLCLSCDLQAATTFFGSVDMSTTSVREQGQTQKHLEGTGSHLGLRGFDTIQPNLESTYLIEAKVGSSRGRDHTYVRQTWVGVRGRLGEVRLGRQLGATQVSSEAVERFKDQYGDYNAILKNEIEHKESVAYIHKVGPLGVAVEVAFDDTHSKSDDFISETDAMLSYSQYGFNVALGSVHAKQAFRTNRASVLYTFPAGHQVGAVFERHKPDAQAGYKAQLVSGAYQWGPLQFKAQYGTNHSDAGGPHENLKAIGLDLQLNKQTKLTLEHSRHQNRNYHKGDTSKATAFGFEYRF